MLGDLLLVHGGHPEHREKLTKQGNFSESPCSSAFSRIRRDKLAEAGVMKRIFGSIAEFVYGRRLMPGKMEGVGIQALTGD